MKKSLHDIMLEVIPGATMAEKYDLVNRSSHVVVIQFFSEGLEKWLAQTPDPGVYSASQSPEDQSQPEPTTSSFLPKTSNPFDL